MHEKDTANCIQIFINKKKSNEKLHKNYFEEANHILDKFGLAVEKS